MLQAKVIVLLSAVIWFGCKSMPDARVESDSPLTMPAKVRLSDKDFSILLPIPAQKFVDHFGSNSRPGDPTLSITDVGSKGELFPASAYKAVLNQINSPHEGPGSDFHFGSVIMTTAPLNPVALRLDPCAPMPVDDDNLCERELRIIWQPGTNDAAIHAIYRLTTAEFKAALSDLRKLKQAASLDYDSQPLGLHPVLAKEGLSGPFATGLYTLIKTYSGADNLSKIAFFVGTGSSVSAWRFGAFTFTAGVATPANIIHTNLAKQEFPGFYRAATFSHGGATEVPNGPRLPVMPVPRLSGPNPGVGAEMITANSSSDAGKPMDKASATEQKLAYEFYLTIENPTLTSLNTNACADCHLASQERIVLDHEVPSLTDLASAKRYAPAPVGKLVPDLTSGCVHNMGYFQSFSSASFITCISQRTVNETAAVVAWMSKHMPDDL